MNALRGHYAAYVRAERRARRKIETLGARVAQAVSEAKAARAAGDGETAERKARAAKAIVADGETLETLLDATAALVAALEAEAQLHFEQALAREAWVEQAAAREAELETELADEQAARAKAETELAHYLKAPVWRGDLPPRFGDLIPTYLRQPTI